MKKTNSNNVTVNVYTCAVYASGMIVGHVEMTNKEVAAFNAANRGELYAKALIRKEVK